MVSGLDAASAETYIELTLERIDEMMVIDRVKDSAAGAVSSFFGTTRDNFQGKRVLHLEYEAYEPMAKLMMTELAGQLRSKFPSIIHIAVVHKLGPCPVRETSIAIAVSSPHRDDAIQGCEWLINNLKMSVPIWKKEVYEDGSVWKENSEWKEGKMAVLGIKSEINVSNRIKSECCKHSRVLDNT